MSLLYLSGLKEVERAIQFISYIFIFSPFERTPDIEKANSIII